MTADCAPVLLCDEDGDCVAAVHAGWRGLAVGIIENAVTALTTFSTSDLIACIGPTISAAHYEVGDDVHRALCVTDDDKAHFTSADNGKWYADLPALAGRRLRMRESKKYMIWRNALIPLRKNFTPLVAIKPPAARRL